MENAVKVGAVFSVNNISTQKKRPKAASAWRNNRSPVRGVAAERKMSAISWPFFFFSQMLCFDYGINRRLTASRCSDVTLLFCWDWKPRPPFGVDFRAAQWKEKIRSTWGHSTAWVSDFVRLAAAPHCSSGAAEKMSDSIYRSHWPLINDQPLPKKLILK
jgi:hypothetical protein